MLFKTTIKVNLRCQLLSILGFSLCLVKRMPMALVTKQQGGRYRVECRG